MWKKFIFKIGIFILAILVIIFLFKLYTNTLKKENIKKYEAFVDGEKYLNDYKNDNLVNNIKYAYYDLDNNGIEELIIAISDGNDFETNLFYTISNNEIKYIDKTYHYGVLKYNRGEKTIFYSAIRPSLSYGWIIEFYKFKDNSFKNIKNIIVEIIDNNQKYYVVENNDNKREITNDEYQKYIGNSIELPFKSIN